uniref:Uncharacterized protein n=1 Tax=Romanomermis culicivorax TaxID=13658 RepID=A0A915L3V1_ROMCU
TAAVDDFSENHIPNDSRAVAAVDFRSVEPDQAAERIDVDQNRKFASTGHSVADDILSAISFDSHFQHTRSASIDSRVDIPHFSDDPKPEPQRLKLKHKLTDLISKELCGRHESSDSRAKRYTNFPILNSNLAVAAAIDEEISCFLEKDEFDAIIGVSVGIFLQVVVQDDVGFM